MKREKKGEREREKWKGEGHWEEEMGIVVCFVCLFVLFCFRFVVGWCFPSAEMIVEVQS